MRLGKRALLAAHMGCLFAAPTANAADVGGPLAIKAAAVGACDAYGLDFIYIERVNTCIRVGGLVRVLGQYTPGQTYYNVTTGAVSQKANAQDTTGLEVRGRLDVDSRVQTDYGVLQAVVWLRGTNNEGIRNAAASTEFMTSATPGANGATTITMERAYVKFAGLTAGVSTENFSTMPDYMFGPALYAGFSNGVKQIAYTYQFGSGFSSTIALEEKNDFGGTFVTAGNGATLAPSVVPYATGVQYNNQFDTSSILVATLRNDAKWGYLQGNVAFTKNTLNGTTLTSAYSPLNDPSSYFAWAAGGSARFLLPFIAPGDEVRFQVAYTQGIVGLLKSAGSLNTVSDALQKRGAGGIITVPQNIIPTTVTPGGAVTSVGQSTGYSVFGMFTHYWSPQWRTNVQMGYMQLFMPTARSNGVGAGLNTQEGNANIFLPGINLIWSPAKQWDIGIEVDYISVNQKIQNPSAAFVAAGQPGLKGNAVSWITRLNRIF